MKASKNNKLKSQLRIFGVILCLAFMVIGFLPYLKAHYIRWWAIGLSAFFLLASIIYPGALYYPHRILTKFGSWLGLINTVLLLSMLYFFVITPMALFFKITGRDILKLKFDPNIDTYREKVTPRSAEHMIKQF